MKKNDLVSVIIPAYNAEKTIEKCVNSILEQTHKNVEIIIVDDGSKDNTKTICENLSKANSKIKFFSKKNGGASSARNFGIKQAEGTYIEFVDSDDYLDSNYIESLFNEYKNNSNIDLVVAGIKINDGVSSVEYLPSVYGIFTKNQFDTAECFLELYSHDFAYLSSPVNKLYKKEFVGKFDENISISEDKVFNINYLKNVKNKISIIRNSGYNYVMNNASITHTFNSKLHIDLQKSNNILIDYIKQYIQTNSEEFIAKKICMPSFYLCVKKAIQSKQDNNVIVNIIDFFMKDVNTVSSFQNYSTRIKDKLCRYLLIKKKNIKLFIKIYKFYLKIM